MLRRIGITACFVATLSACDPGPSAPEQAERISLDQARGQPGEPAPSPNTEDAIWTVSENGQAINFGDPDAPPLLTLSCALREEPVHLRIIRHAPARPGVGALFPVIGNGMISRFKLDAKLNEGEWRWEGMLPSDDPSLDVFTGRREIEATLPGNGSLLIEGSRIPGEFISWCRAGGDVKQVEAEENAEEPAASDSLSE